MKQSDSQVTSLQREVIDSTNVILPPLPSEDLPIFQLPGFLVYPNRASANQTDEDHVNGNSNSLELNLGNYLMSPPNSLPPNEHFQTIQKWEGHVLKVGTDSFWARITPVVGEGTNQDAEIYLEEVDSADRLLIEPGSIFYWSIGYLDRPSGRLRTSILRFRRLPTWDLDELANAEAEAEKILRLFEVD